MSSDAAARWASGLAAWAIPDDILARAPEDPWRLPVTPFARAAVEERDTPSRRHALEQLPQGGTVLDVGCGAGAAGFALAARAALVVGVDESEAMLSAFRDIAAERSIPIATHGGRWPDVAPAVGSAEVVVCHHVVYNVPDIEPFVLALSEHARARVVVELTGEHPRAWMNPYWERFWRLQRPNRPTARDLVGVLTAVGLDPRMEESTQPGHMDHREELVAMIRRHLCLPASREAEVGAAFDELGPPPDRRVVTLWWDV